MKWTKIVLIFQALITLTLGLIFFAQVLSLNVAKVSEIRVQISEGNISEGEASEYIDVKQRYASAAYILLFISLMELIIITKLLT